MLHDHQLDVAQLHGMQDDGAIIAEQTLLRVIDAGENVVRDRHGRFLGQTLDDQGHHYDPGGPIV